MCVYVCVYIYIYIYIYISYLPARAVGERPQALLAALSVTVWLRGRQLAVCVMYVCVYIYIYIHIYVHTYLCVYIYIYIYMYRCVHISIYLSLSLSLYIYIYIPSTIMWLSPCGFAGQLSKVRSGKMGSAPGRFERSKGILR